MDSGTATKAWMTPEEAVAYLDERYQVGYHLNTLLKKAAAGEIPSEKVGKFRRFVRADLDAWARGEWKPEPAAAESEAL